MSCPTNSDPNNLTLMAVSFTTPAHGYVFTPDANGDGGFVYKPATGFYGTDSFAYEAKDSQATSSAATVTNHGSGMELDPTANP